MSLLVLRNTASLLYGAIFCGLTNPAAGAAYALGRVIRRNKRIDRSGVIWGCAIQSQQGITVPPVRAPVLSSRAAQNARVCMLGSATTSFEPWIQPTTTCKQF
jgi:hypothetical protein